MLCEWEKKRRDTQLKKKKRTFRENEFLHELLFVEIPRDAYRDEKILYTTVLFISTVRYRTLARERSYPVAVLFFVSPIFLHASPARHHHHHHLYCLIYLLVSTSLGLSRIYFVFYRCCFPERSDFNEKQKKNRLFLCVDFSYIKVFQTQCILYSTKHTKMQLLYEGGLKSFRPQHEDGSTRQWKLVNVVVHLLTVTH